MLRSSVDDMATRLGDLADLHVRYVILGSLLIFSVILCLQTLRYDTTETEHEQEYFPSVLGKTIGTGLPF